MKPTPEKILQTIIAIITESHDMPATTETTIGELQKAGMDSLDQVELAMELEEELGLELDEFDPLPPEMTLAQMAEKISQMQPN